MASLLFASRPSSQASPRPDRGAERRLTLQVLALGWLGQLVLGVVLAQLAPVPERPLLIDRHRCDPAGWQALVGRYRALYRQHALQQQRFRPVLESSVFGVQHHRQPPDPRSLAVVAAVGEGDGAAAAALRRRFPQALVLACSPPAPGEAAAPGTGALPGDRAAP
jgi:hypothetical protein